MLEDVRRYVRKNNPNSHGSSGKSTYIYNITNNGAQIDVENAQFVKINANEANLQQITAENIDTTTLNAATITSGSGNINSLSGSSLIYDQGQISDIQCSTITGNGLTFDKAEINEAIINELKSRNITTEYLTVTKSAHFFELIIDKIKSVGGQMILSAANAKIDYVEAYNSSDVKVDLDANNVAYYKLYWKATDEAGHDVSNDWLSGDQAICQNFCDVNDVTGASGNKYYWRLVKSVDEGSKMWIDLEGGLKSSTEKIGYDLDFLGVIYENEYLNSSVIDDYNDEWIVTPEYPGTWTSQSAYDERMMTGKLTVDNSLHGLSIIPYYITDEEDPYYNGVQPPLSGDVDDIEMYVNHHIIIALGTPANIYAEAQYDDGTSDYYISQTMLQEHFFDINPLKNIVKIILRPIEQRKWTKCNWLTVSNLQNEKDVDMTGYESIPSRDDEIVQLGYRWNALPNPTDDDKARASAIIIAAYKTPDTAINPPSYAQYRLINDFSLNSFRQTYFDATTARFVGSFVTDTGAVINDELFESYRILPSKTILTKTDTAIGASLIKNNNGSSSIVNVVPQGYTLEIMARTPTSSYGFTYSEGSTIGTVNITNHRDNYTHVDITLKKYVSTGGQIPQARIADQTKVDYIDTDVSLTGYATQQYVDDAIDGITIPNKYQYKILPKEEDVIVKLTDEQEYEDIVSTLLVNLEYELIRTDGTDIESVTFGNTGMYLYIDCLEPTWTSTFTLSGGTGTFSNQNILNVINPVGVYNASYRDYRKIPNDLRRPKEFHILLYDKQRTLSDAKILDERILYVTFNAGSIFKVTEAGMTSAVADAVGEASSIIEQTAENILLQVNETGINIQDKKIYLNSENTIFNSNINMTNPNEGLVLYDANNVPRVGIYNNNVTSNDNLWEAIYDTLTSSGTSSTTHTFSHTVNLGQMSNGSFTISTVTMQTLNNNSEPINISSCSLAYTLYQNGTSIKTGSFDNASIAKQGNLGKINDLLGDDISIESTDTYSITIDISYTFSTAVDNVMSIVSLYRGYSVNNTAVQLIGLDGVMFRSGYEKQLKVGDDIEIKNQDAIIKVDDNQLLRSGINWNNYEREDPNMGELSTMHNYRIVSGSYTPELYDAMIQIENVSGSSVTLPTDTSYIGKSYYIMSLIEGAQINCTGTMWIGGHEPNKHSISMNDHALYHCMRFPAGWVVTYSAYQ